MHKPDTEYIFIQPNADGTERTFSRHEIIEEIWHTESKWFDGDVRVVFADQPFRVYGRTLVSLQ